MASWWTKTVEPTGDRQGWPIRALGWVGGWLRTYQPTGGATGAIRVGSMGPNPNSPFLPEGVYSPCGARRGIGIGPTSSPGA